MEKIIKENGDNSVRELIDFDPNEVIEELINKINEIVEWINKQ
tara:strand:+ start:597 stop:725 length:129 start_codon:yes stop_codon:yes gene_type:complete